MTPNEIKWIKDDLLLYPGGYWQSHIKALLTEVKQLKAEMVTDSKRERMQLDTISQLLNEVERLRALVLKYGWHTSSCKGSLTMKSCLCEYLQIQDKLLSKETPPDKLKEIQARIKKVDGPDCPDMFADIKALVSEVKHLSCKYDTAKQEHLEDLNLLTTKIDRLRKLVVRLS